MNYLDIKITDDGIEWDADGIPVMVSDADSIVQDIKHMIRETGLLIALVGERSTQERQIYITQIIIKVEDDERVVPGTVKMEISSQVYNDFTWTLTFETYEYGTVTT